METDIETIPRELPAEATEEITHQWDDGSKHRADYFIEGKRVWSRTWNDAGQLIVEQGVRGNVPHGPYRFWYNNGQLCEESFYFEGKEHGTYRYYDQNGDLASTYTTQYGIKTGRWYQRTGILSEECFYVEGDRRLQRWRSEQGEDSPLLSESYYRNGERHGILREWTRNRRLTRGFPQYFVNGEKVTKACYLTTCQQDASLHPYQTADDLPYRKPL